MEPFQKLLLDVQPLCLQHTAFCAYLVHSCVRVIKHNIQNTKIMASGAITSWQIHGETMADFIFGGSKITADATAALKLKDTLKKSYGKKKKKKRKAMANLEY